MESLSDSRLAAKTDEFRLRLQKGETLDDIEKEKEQKNRRSIKYGLILSAVIGGVGLIVAVVKIVLFLVG